jgi:transcriptional regulator with XRE-family HTH domain
VPNAEAAALLRELGKRVAAARKARDLSQEALAEAMGISPGYVRRVEGGRENLTLESVAKFAAAVGVSAWELLGPPNRH